ncbi:MAG: hypothetical protein ACTHOO_08780 [Alcanivorax sp.]
MRAYCLHLISLLALFVLLCIFADQAYAIDTPQPLPTYCRQSRFLGVVLVVVFVLIFREAIRPKDGVAKVLRQLNGMSVEEKVGALFQMRSADSALPSLSDLKRYSSFMVIEMTFAVISVFAILLFLLSYFVSGAVISSFATVVFIVPISLWFAHKRYSQYGEFLFLHPLNSALQLVVAGIFIALGLAALVYTSEAVSSCHVSLFYSAMKYGALIATSAVVMCLGYLFLIKSALS